MKYQINIIKPVMLVVFSFCAMSIALTPPDFIVYYVQGSVKKINVSKPFALKKGDKLSANDMISITSRSQIILICKNYNNIKLDKPDTVRLNSIESRCSAGKPSFTLAYFHFIWDELFGQKPDEQEYLHNIGAVRIRRGPKEEKPPLFLDTINYLKGDLKVKFDEGHTLMALNVFDGPAPGKPLFTLANISNNFNLDTLTSRLRSPGVYYWTVSADQRQAPKKYYLKIWGKKEYRHAVDSLLKTVIKTEPAETAYMSGFVMEKNSFLTEAGKYYKTAYKLEPRNKIYQTANSRFL